MPAFSAAAGVGNIVTTQRTSIALLRRATGSSACWTSRLRSRVSGGSVQTRSGARIERRASTVSAAWRSIGARVPSSSCGASSAQASGIVQRSKPRMICGSA